MSDVTYVCQTYEERSTQAGKTLAIAKQFSCDTAAAAEERALRAYEAGHCVGADAYAVTYDTDADELTDMLFLARFGRVPSTDES